LSSDQDEALFSTFQHQVTELRDATKLCVAYVNEHPQEELALAVRRVLSELKAQNIRENEVRDAVLSMDSRLEAVLKEVKDEPAAEENRPA
jgi:hypothetical protein